MSATPPAPGWWQASDGNWYPPHLHPDAVHRAPEPTSAPPQYPPTQQYPPAGAAQYPPAGPPTQQYPPTSAPEQYPPSQQYPPSAPAQYPPSQQYPPAGAQYPQFPPADWQGGAGGSTPPPIPGSPMAAGVPPMGPSRRSRTAFWVVAIASLLVIALVGAVLVGVFVASNENDVAVSNGAARPTETTQPDSAKPDAPAVDVPIEGGDDGDLDELVGAAITDIQAFWTEQMPATFNKEYQPVGGGFYAWSPGEPPPPCTTSEDEIAGNAYYCGESDVVAWDESSLVPHLLEAYGNLAVAIVFAHEWGHAIQARVGMRGATVTMEQQADCYAGAWVEHVKAGDSDYFTADGKALDLALAGFLEIADSPGTAAIDPNAHGSAFDRINAFKDGLDGGAEACSGYSDQTVGERLTEIDWLSTDDMAAGGNAPYDEVVELMTTDLEEFWTVVAKDRFQATWEPLKAPVAFDSDTADAPACGDTDTEDYSLFYCADERFIAYDDGSLFPSVYENIGDFGVATLYGSQYALAAEDQLGFAPDGERKQNDMADCLVGAWTASIFNQDRRVSNDEERLQLSPGDFDEAVKALLAFGSSSDEKDAAYGTGFERVGSFRDGAIKGLDGCGI